MPEPARPISKVKARPKNAKSCQKLKLKPGQKLGMEIAISK
jgi:hypothetical protein